MYPGQYPSSASPSPSIPPSPSASVQTSQFNRSRRVRIFLFGLIGAFLLFRILHHARPENFKSSNHSLEAFYSRHVACRSCLRSPSSAPWYAPSQAQRWCSINGKRASKDSEGVCVPLSSHCSDGSSGIVLQSQCPQDAADTKVTCISCVLDSYTWCTNKRAVDRGDEYDGICYNPSQTTQHHDFVPSSHSSSFVCPSGFHALELHHCVNIINEQMPIKEENTQKQSKASNSHHIPVFLIICVIALLGVAVFLILRRRRLLRQSQAPALINQPPPQAFAAVQIQQPQQPFQQPQQQQQQQQQHYYSPPQPQAPAAPVSSLPQVVRQSPMPVAQQPFAAAPPSRSLYPSLSSRGDEMEMPYIRMNDQEASYPTIR
jgi:hypothetical protein